MKLISALPLLMLGTTTAFISPSSNAFVGNNLERSQSAKLNLLPDIVGSGDLTSLQHLLESSSTLLSDAAAATADAAAADDGGWWQNYLSVYKSLLIGVHSTIDQPLRNAGWDQTWGVSIAVFTASKFKLTKCS